MKASRSLAIGAILLVPVLTGAFVVQERRARDGARLFGQVLAIVSDRFVDSVDVNALYEKAARGMLAELRDPYSELYTPKQLEAFNTNTGGFYGGVGMLIEDQQGLITVSRVFPHTPAEEAGIREGDRIVGVDTFSTRGWKMDQVSGKLKGTPGSTVTAKFARPGVPDPIVATFTRRVIRIPAVPYAVMLPEKVAYIPVQQFSETAAQELATNLMRLSNEGAKALVLDLRGNGGGYLEQALEMANMFVPKGQTLLSVRGRQGPADVYSSQGEPIAPKIPMVILTDGYTASASEIVAGALQDHDRALILGTTSFGKGLVQTVYQLDGGYAIKLTTAKWYTPSGRSIQKERRLLDDGSFVEVRPDSVESDSSRRARPKFRSDSGRTVYGGGAITPDVIVQLDTITTPEQQFVRKLASKQQDVYLALYDYAFSMKNSVKPDFTVDASMRDAFFAALQKRGVVLDRADYDAARPYIDRILATRIARLAFGDSIAKKREIGDDAQLMKALELIKKGRTQREIFAVASQYHPEKRGK
ncbi:MAG: S41 family peptidase [Gemmatimonadaceae bacterium]|nr:S41 family peptidase [Gemmatimonadaceae bacterium]